MKKIFRSLIVLSLLNTAIFAKDSLSRAPLNDEKAFIGFKIYNFTQNFFIWELHQYCEDLILNNYVFFRIKID